MVSKIGHWMLTWQVILYPKDNHVYESIFFAW